jgi:hypothetical protein
MKTSRTRKMKIEMFARSIRDETNLELVYAIKERKKGKLRVTLPPTTK